MVRWDDKNLDSEGVYPETNSVHKLVVTSTGYMDELMLHWPKVILSHPIKAGSELLLTSN